MDNDLPNPVLTDDAEAELLLNAAHEEDHKPFEDSGETTEVTAAAAPELEADTPTAEELADPANANRPRDPGTGKFVKRKSYEAAQKPATEAVDASKTDPNAPAASDYEKKKQEKAAKEKERQDRSWENLNREKDELARRKREWEQREQQLRNPQQQRQAPEARQFSSQQLFDAKNEFRKAARDAFKRYQEHGNEADLDAFNQNDQWADQAEQNAIQFFEMEERENHQAAIQQQQGVWIQNMETVIKADPNLTKADSPISVHLQDLLKTHGTIFQMVPDGFAKAVEIAKLRLDAADAPTLREQNALLKKENERLTGLTSLSKGGPTGGPAVKKSFDNLPLEEMGAELQRMAELEDGT